MNRLGLILVVLGFGIFLFIPFLTQHHITREIIATEYGSEEKSALANTAYTTIINQNTTTWKLLSVTKKAIEQVNQEIIKKYAFSAEDITRLENLAHNNSLNAESLTALWGAESFKVKAFNSYGNWLFGREFSSDEELESSIKQVANNIALYEVTPKKGIDKYAAKSLKYNLAKHSITGLLATNAILFFILTFGFTAIGGLLMFQSFMNQKSGIKNDGIFFHPAKSRKWLGIIIGTLLISFYILLYFFPEYMAGWIRIVDPISYKLSGSEAGQFFLYGVMYTVSVLVMGARMMAKYRHNKYQLIRSGSVMFFQTIFAFLIPEILVRLNKPYFDFKNAWPLDYDFFFGFELDKLIAGGNLGMFMLVWGITFSLIGVPIFTYFYGKRWYCSWVCGCGGLAETVGDPFRQLSDKSLKAWKIERYMIYSVLVFAVVMTIGVLYTYFTGSSELVGINTYTMRQVYGAFIGAGFSGVVGTGFYPVMGNRVW